MAQSWHRQEGESQKAYEAFLVYRDLGVDRSLDAVVRKCNKHRSLLARWSSKHGWVERAQDYDDHITGIQHAQRQAAIINQSQQEADVWAQRLRESREQEWEMSQQLMTQARAALGGVEKWTVRDCIAAMQLSSELMDHAANQLSTLVAQHEVEEEDLVRVVVQYQAVHQPNGQDGQSPYLPG